jgi:thioredoxin 2
MSGSTVVECPSCGQKNRVRAAATGAPHCGSCGKPLPWLAEVAEADFADVVERSPLPVLIDFWAPWCGPCRIVSPIVERLAVDLAGRLKVVNLNTDQEPVLAEGHGIRGIPTLILYDGGRERDRVTGALPSDALRSWVESRLPSGASARPSA